MKKENVDACRLKVCEHRHSDDDEEAHAELQPSILPQGNIPNGFELRSPEPTERGLYLFLRGAASIGKRPHCKALSEAEHR